jgi:casein kinase I homolog HRR25
MNEVKALEFESQPNYKQLKQYFQDEIDSNGSKIHFQYDWESLPEYQQKKKHMTVHIM